MEDFRRKLIMSVCDGHPKAWPLIYPLERFKLRDHMYMWLIKNKLTGQNFVDMCGTFSYKWGSYGNFILKKIKKEKKAPLMFADLLK